MSLLGSLVNHLRQSPDVEELLSGRIYPNSKAPMTTSMPYLTFHRVSDVPLDHLRGSSRMRFVDVDLSIYAKTYTEVWAVRDAVYDAIGRDGFRGEWDGLTVVARWDSEGESHTASISDDDDGEHEITMTLNLRHTI